MSIVNDRRPWPARGLVALALAVAGTSCGKAPGPVPGRPRPAGFKRYDEPKEALEFYARKRAPVGQRAIPSERYRVARESMAGMPVYSTRTGAFASAAGRSRGGVSAATTGGPDIGTWTALGPGNIGGRTRAIVIHPLPTQSTMYAAAVAGGVWKTTNSGTTWAPTDDAMANLAVSTLAMDPNASGTLLAGTGEGYFNGDAVRGAGIFKTTNGGTNWAQIDSPGTGLDKTCEFHYVNKIVYSRQQANTAYAAVGYSANCDGSNQGGVYRTTDGGSTWTRILATSVSGGCLDLAVRNVANDPLFASCGTFAAAEIYRNNSALVTPTAFTNITSTVASNLAPFMGRTSLAIAPNNQSTIYAISADNSLDDFLGLWRSTDGGFTWDERSSYQSPSPTRRLFTNLPFADGCPGFGSGSYNQGWYDNVITVDPSDEDKVWVGGIDLFRSVDGGQSFGLASFWYESGSPSYAHADQHALVFNATGSLFVGNDGGLFRSDNPNAALATDTCDSSTSSVTFTTLNNGYAVTQFYYGAVLPDDSGYLGGAQDNGTLRGSPSNTDWSEQLGGDGGAVAVNPINTQILYGEYTDGAIQRSTDGGSTWNDAVVGINDTGFEFIAPFVMDPSAPIDAAAARRLWTGGHNLWRTINDAVSWTRASTTLASSTTAIAVAPSNPNFALAGTKNGAIHRNTAALSAGASTAWPSKTPRTGYVSSVTFDPWDANVAYATYSTFGGTHVWKSTDAGANWTGLDGTTGFKIPDLPVHSIVVDPTTSNRLYIGTDLGVFVSIDGGVKWSKENDGFGNVVTEHLVINGANLYAFTHGRGVWRVPLTNASQTALIELTAAASSVAEGTTQVDVFVRLRTSNNLALASPVSVDYATADGTAQAGSDYTQTTGTLTFAAGFLDTDTKTISIPIINDSVGEPTQAFTLNLSSPSAGAILARRLHTITIHDDGDPPGVAIGDITVTEGNSGAMNAVFTVRLSGPAPAGASVKYQTADGTGLAGVDYQSVGVPTPVTLSLPAGTMSRTLTVPVFGNTVAQASRTFVVNLSAPSANVSLDDAQGQATIVDNDFSGMIELSAAAYSVNENAGNATIMLKRTGGVASGVSVQVETQDGTASSVANADFTATSKVVSFAAGATTASFTVPITNDTIDEPAETVLLRIFGPVGLGATLGAQQTAILTINDDDVPGQVKFGTPTYTVAEGGGVDLKVSRTGGAASAVTVGYTIAGTATGGGVDYTLTPASLTFAAGEMMKTIHVDAVADGLPEGNETVVVTLNPPGGGATLGTPSATVLTITDLESTFAFTVSQVTIAETAKTVMATVRRTGPLTTPATVHYATTNGTATGGTGPGDDFLPTSGTLSFAPNVPTKIITVTLRPDSDFESPEDFTIDLSAPTVAVLGSPSSLTVHIPNDDLGGTFFFAAPTYTVLESKPSVVLSVKRTGGMANADVTYQTAVGTASSLDFTGTAGNPLHFAAGKPSATITIPILPDTIGEGNETFTVSLSAPTAGGTLGTPSTATVTIQDDDRVVSFGAPSYTIKESPSVVTKLVVPVRRTGPAGAFTVNYAASGTATIGGDYSLLPVPGVLSFGATETVKYITLSVNPDVAPPYEGNETVILTLSGASGAGLGTFASTTVNITDDAPVIQLGAATYTFTEPVGTTPGQALITVKRTGNLQSGSQVSYTINPGSATDGSDYNSAGATPPPALAFLSGQSQIQIKVPILPDTEDEPAETFTVTLSSPVAASLGSLVTTTVTINDNDTAGKIQIAGTQYVVTEGAGSAVIKLTRSLGNAGNASVVCRTADGSASAGSDYTATVQTVTFATGQTSATCTIPITDDGTTGEGAETVLVSLDTPSYGVTIGSPSTAILYILDND